MTYRLLLVLLLLAAACDKSTTLATSTEAEGAHAEHDEHAHHAGHGDHAEHAGHDEHADHQHEILAAAEASEGSLYQLDITLEDHKGNEFAWASQAGEPVLVAIIYTSCTTACPMIVSEMMTLRKNAGSDVKTLLISMDAKRDDVAALAAMHERHQLDDRWTVARTSPDNLRMLAAALGVRYRELPSGEFSHSQVITLLNPDGEIDTRMEGIGPQRHHMAEALKAL